MEAQKNKIPLFKKWSHWYILVLVVLLLLIAFFSWLTKFFS